MSRSIVDWSPTDELALAAVQGRLQALFPSGTLGRPEVLKLLVRAAAAGTTAGALLARRCLCEIVPGEGSTVGRVTSPDCAIHGDR